MVYRTKTIEDTINFGKALGRLLNAGDVLALQGTLAAGKTQLTKGIAQGLGISEAVTSPTFTIISEYYGRLPLYHMDVYRLSSPEDFLDLGVEDMLYGQGVCIIDRLVPSLFISNPKKIQAELLQSLTGRIRQTV